MNVIKGKQKVVEAVWCGPYLTHVSHLISKFIF